MNQSMWVVVVFWTFFLMSIAGNCLTTRSNRCWNNPKPPLQIFFMEVVRGNWGTSGFWIDFSRQMVGEGNQNISGKLGGGFKYFFHPENWGNDPIFQMGWNHQLENLGWWNMIPLGRNFPIWFWYFWMKVVATYAKVYLPIGRAVLPLWNPLSLVVENTRKPMEL